MAPRTPRRSQPERRAETERRVIDAAIRLIAERGSRAVSLAEVGRLAGYSRGIVHHHFGSRGRLLAAVVRHAQLFEVPDGDGDGLDRLAVLVGAYLRNLRAGAPRARAFLLLWAEALAADPDLVPLFAERDAWFRGLLADLVRRGVDDGSVRADADPEAVAVALLGMLRGIGMQLMSHQPLPPPDLLVTQTVTAVRRGLAAN